MPDILEFQGEYRFLSNFYPSPIEEDGVVYPTVEHYFQSKKTIGFSEKKRIIGAETPSLAKKYGGDRSLTTMRSDWDAIKLRVMATALKLKFDQNQSLKARLLATGSSKLVEGNYWNDTFWGVCRGYGRNELGLLLMRLRDEYRRGENNA